MLANMLSLALLALSTAALLVGLRLIWRRRDGWRWFGLAVSLLALLIGAAQVALSTVPFFSAGPLINVPLLEQLRITLLNLAGLGLGVGLVLIAVRWLLARQKRIRRPGASALLLGLLLLGVGGMFGLVQLSADPRAAERDPNRRAIQVAQGFAWSVYTAGQTDNPTAIAFGPDQNLYIGDINGGIWRAADLDGDGSAESVTSFAEGFRLLTGLVWRADELFVADSGKISVLRDTDGDGVADQRRVIVEGLPSLVLYPHSNNALAFGPDGRLYFGVGSTTSGEVEQNPYAAALLSVNPDGSDLQVYARGLGNTFDIAFNSAGALFGGDNSPGMGDAEQGLEAPPDELNHLVEGGHYGYPYFYGDPPRTGSTRAPVGLFPAHASPNGITFYQAEQFPREYYDNAFIALWSTGELTRIELAQSAGGNYLSRTSTFASGFLYPLDVIVGPDGALYLADFGTSAVYRITYVGEG